MNLTMKNLNMVLVTVTFVIFVVLLFELHGDPLLYFVMHDLQVIVYDGA